MLFIKKKLQLISLMWLLSATTWMGRQRCVAQSETAQTKPADKQAADNNAVNNELLQAATVKVASMAANKNFAEPMLTAKLQLEFVQQFVCVHKLIPRVTYFTCQRPARLLAAQHNDNDNNNDDADNADDATGSDYENEEAAQQRLRALYESKNSEILQHITLELYVKLVNMDVLDVAAATKQQRVRGTGQAGANIRQGISHAEWLDTVLQYEDLRHFVVVDLACGYMSRRLLELASNKMLFNAKFHWLLLEDYVLHVKSFGKHNFAQDVVDDAAPAEQATQLDANGQAMEPIERFIAKLNFHVNTELTLAKRAVWRTDDLHAAQVAGFRLFDVWNPGLQYGGTLNITEVGNFTLAQGLRLFHWFRMTNTLMRRMNMQLARIRVMNVVTNKNMPGTLEHYLTTPTDIHIDSMNRFNFNLLLAVRDMFNMSFVLMRTTSWGYLKNGKFDGMISALIKKQVDLAGSPIYYWPERHRFIDAAARTWISRPCFIFRHPHSTTKDRIVFLQPFTDDVWLLTACCGALTVFILWLLTTIEMKLVPNADASLIKPKGMAQQMSQQQQPTLPEQPKKPIMYRSKRKAPAQISAVCPAYSFNATTLASHAPAMAGGRLQRCGLRMLNVLRRRRSGSEHKRAGLFLESVLFYVGIICQQGLGFSTSFVSGRCIVITSLLFSFCIYQFYSASIVGTLLMEKPKTIRTLTDLVHSTLQVGVEDILYNRDYFMRTKDPVAMELYAKKISSLPSNTNENVAAVVTTPAPTLPAGTAAKKEKSYREIVHSHEQGAHAKASEASNWLDAESGIRRMQTARFAFHIDVATAYKIIGETFNEREICDLSEISLFPPQKTVSVMQKNSPLRKVVAYGLRRVIEAGIMNYQVKVWHSRKPQCVKQLEAADLHVDMSTVSSALLMLIFGYCLTLVALCIEILHFKLKQRAMPAEDNNHN